MLKIKAQIKEEEENLEANQQAVKESEEHNDIIQKEYYVLKNEVDKMENPARFK